ncbi:MAG: outer membrane protein assembly factor BamD [Saprospiraceae bacterium]
MTLCKFTYFFFAFSFFTLISCKSEYEKLRTSGNTKAIMAKAMDYYKKGDYTKAQGLYDLIISNLRGSVDAEKVYFEYAYTHFHLQKFVSSAYYFKQFSQTFPNSELKEEADYMSAYSEYKMSPIYRLDQTATAKAVDELQLFMNTYPTSTRIKECNKLIDELRVKLEKKAFEEGELYFNLREYQAAIQSYNNLLKDFPETSNAELVHYKIALSAYNYATNSILSKQEDRYKLAREESKDFLLSYEKSKFRKEIAFINKDSQLKLKEIENDRHQNKSTRN